MNVPGFAVVRYAYDPAMRDRDPALRLDAIVLATPERIEAHDRAAYLNWRMRARGYTYLVVRVSYDPHPSRALRRRDRAAVKEK